MLFPLQKLIEGNDPIVCTSRNETVQRALDKMIDNNYSQLPIIDENGHLLGVLSEQRIIQHYRLIGYEGTLQLPVLDLSSPSVTLSPDVDIFEALGSLKNTSAIIVISNKKPIGIVT